MTAPLPTLRPVRTSCPFCLGLLARFEDVDLHSCVECGRTYNAAELEGLHEELERVKRVDWFWLLTLFGAGLFIFGAFAGFIAGLLVR